MTPSQYDPCPCGSGKAFKFCCKAIWPGIQNALEQEASGQHDRALKLIDEVTAAHPDKPEAWGHKARLLYANGKPDEADEALEKAFALNANYPFGLFLRANFRYHEREYQGALLLARRAVEAYDPGAVGPLGELWYMIFDGEMRRNRPVAARAALAACARLSPGEEEVQQTFDSVFGAESRLPASARKPYALRKPPGGTAGPRRQAWDRAIAPAAPRLSELARAFEELTQQEPGDGPAWFNLGLARAWLGDNTAALLALEQYLEREADEAAAAEAAALGEVLRCGAGLEDECDYQEYSLIYQFHAVEPVQRLISDWNDSRRLIPLPTDQENVLTAILLELTTTGLVTVGRPAADAGRMAGYLMIVGNVLRLAGPLKEPYERARDEVRQKLALGLGDLRERRGPAGFSEVVTEALIFPVSPADEQEAAARVLEHAGRYYEDTWVQRPRRSLSNITPVDAAGHAKLRKKLLGVIQFIQECAAIGMLRGYDFDRLRRRLGLLGAAPQAASAAGDIAAMGAAELGGLSAEGLSNDELERAYQSAHKLDAQELAAHFAQALVARPAEEGKDRFPFHSFLIQKALRDGEYDTALDRVNEGEKADCEHNGGKRRDDYELFRAQAHAKRGEADAAEDVFRRLIDRGPGNFQTRGKAAETMMGLKQPGKARRFAEEGLAAARKANDRDSERWMQELAEAARRQGG